MTFESPRSVPAAIADLARLAVAQPLSHPVPADDFAHWRRKGPWKLAWRTLQRQAQLAASGQPRLLRSSIPPTWRSCLWIHAEAPQVGDALMDLAPRSLLHAHGIEVDLLAAPHLAELFTHDRWFRAAYADGRALDPLRYDFVIVASHARRALAPKLRFVPTLPWLSLAAFYSVPDYHRSQFVTQRLADGLGVVLDAPAIALHARQKLEPAATHRPAIPPARGAGPLVALALGGVKADRTYRHWPAVLAGLHAAGLRRFLLIGSANGLADRAALMATAPADVEWQDAVDRTDLPGTQALLAACDLAICADGGLMHLALTTRAPVLALFSAAIAPEWRLPVDLDGAALRAAQGEVSTIRAVEVTQTALRLLARKPVGR